MKRKTLDALITTAGGILLLLLLAVGGAAMWGYSYANGTVHDQLAAQQIYFPPAAAFAKAVPGGEITPGMIPYLEKYAGQQLVNGAQAEAYSEHFIAVHIQEIGQGKTYAQLSAAAMALPKGSAAYTKAEAVVDAVFKGTALRSMLLQAYAFWMLGQIAKWVGIGAFVFAAAILVLVGLGVWHTRRTPADRTVGSLDMAVRAAKGVAA